MIETGFQVEWQRPCLSTVPLTKLDGGGLATLYQPTLQTGPNAIARVLSVQLGALNNDFSVALWYYRENGDIAWLFQADAFGMTGLATWDYAISHVPEPPGLLIMQLDRKYPKIRIEFAGTAADYVGGTLLYQEGSIMKRIPGFDSVPEKIWWK